MPLPGMRGADHLGFTVPDLEEAHEFLVDVLGAQYVYTLGPSSTTTTGWRSNSACTRAR